MKLIACATPGRIGDTLFSLPTIKALCQIHEAKADLFVHPWCEPARSLIEYQSFINSMRTDVPERPSAGRHQPCTDIPDNGKYEATFDVSWATEPLCPLPEAFPDAVGLSRDVGRNLELEVPDDVPQQVLDALSGCKDYVVLTPKSRMAQGFQKLFEQFAATAPWPVIITGARGEGIGVGLDLTGMSFLDMARTIKHAKAFVGTFSSPLVVAQSFEVPKTCVYDGASWYPRQIIKDGETDYLVNPTVKQLIESAGRKLRVKRINPLSEPANQITVNGVEVNRLMNDQDAQEYRRLVDQVPVGGSMLELGCFEGGSLASVADIIKAKNIQVYAVDLFDTVDPMTADGNVGGRADGMLKRFKQNMARAGLYAQVICGTSRNIQNMFKDCLNRQKLGLIFLDADHRYESVHEDINNLWPLVAEGGTLAGHDYDKDHTGVVKAVTEKFGENVSVTEGTQIWRVKK